MTNEEKVDILVSDYYINESDSPQGAQAVRYGAEKMAEWKDQRFKEYLENMFKRLDGYANDCIREGDDFSAALYVARADTLRMVINEFFKED